MRVSILRTWRVALGMNQTELAKMIDVSQATVSRLENGEGGTSKEIAERLSRVLNVPVENLGLLRVKD